MSLVTQMVRDLESDHTNKKEEKSELPLFAAANLLYGKNHQPTAKRARLIVLVALMLAIIMLLFDRVLLPQHFKWKLNDQMEKKQFVETDAELNTLDTLDLYIDESKMSSSDVVSESVYSSDYSNVNLNDNSDDKLNDNGSDIESAYEIESTYDIEKISEIKKLQTGQSDNVVLSKETEVREVIVNTDKAESTTQRRLIYSETAVLQASTSPPSKLKIQRPINQESTDIQDYEKALALLSASGPIAAIDYLSQSQSQSEAEIKSRQFFKSVILYASLLIETQRYSTAEWLLQQYQAAHPRNYIFPKLRIRSALAQFDYPKALALLDNVSVPINEDAEFTELRAVTQQAQSRYVDAEVSYKELLQFDNRRARWWMGLAVALDGSANFKQAEQAYQQVLLSEDLTTEYNVYALRRINDLSQK